MEYEKKTQHTLVLDDNELETIRDALYLVSSNSPNIIDDEHTRFILGNGPVIMLKSRHRITALKIQEKLRESD